MSHRLFFDIVDRHDLLDIDYRAIKLLIFMIDSREVSILQKALQNNCNHVKCMEGRENVDKRYELRQQKDSPHKTDLTLKNNR